LIQNRFSPASGRQADTGDAVFSEQGMEAIIAILGAEEFFGEGYLAGQAQRIATVTTMTDSVIARLEKSAIIQMAKNHPHASPVLPGNKRRKGPMKLRANCVIIS
jgi:hypothetical protein